MVNMKNVLIVGLSVSVAALVGYMYISESGIATPEDVTSPINSSGETTMSLTLSSPTFENGGAIPQKYTCDGEEINPELHIGNVPEGAQSLVLVMDDPDIPEAAKRSRGIQKWDHWVLYNIPPDTRVIQEGEVIGSAGKNTLGEPAYQGPCPPDGAHRYIFRLYALPGPLNFIQIPTLDEVESAAKGSTLASTTLTGIYGR